MKRLIWTMFLRFGLSVCFLCGKAATEQSQESPIVESVVGFRAEIPCNVPEPLSDDEASLILWYRSDSANPIYTLDVRGVPLKEAKHFPAPEMGARATFDTVTHPPRLVLDPVQEVDRADYRCRVDLKRSRTLILYSRLEVIVPPGIPIIMDEHGQHLHDVVGPYDEASGLIFICEVDGGQPSPEVTWWRGGSTLLDDSFNVTQQGFVRNELVLERIEREDWMSEFVCQASNNNYTQPTQASLQLDMNLMPLSSRILSPQLPVVAGQPLDVTCETVGSRPRALTSWRLGEVEAGPGEAHTDDRNATLSTLSLVPSPEDDGKELLCRSANPVLSKDTLEARMVLTVQYPPSLNLTLWPTSAYLGAKEGADVKLMCNVRANPAVYNVTWLFDGRPLTTDMSLGVLVVNHTLFLQKTRREHRGTYKCQAHNEIGKGDSNPLQLTVQFSPVCKRSSPSFHGISPSENTELRCEVEADPPEVQFQWSFNSSLLDIEGPLHWNVDSNASTLHYSPKTEAGYGSFTCLGTNALGTQKEPCVFRVVPAGPPESPYDCLVTNQTSTSVSVTCHSGYNGSLPQTFHLEVYNSGAEFLAHNLTSLETPQFEATELEPSTSYVLVLYASNAKGRSKTLALVAGTLTPPKRRTAREVSSSLNPILGIVIGILIIFTVSIIVLISIAKSRRRHPQSYKKESSGGDGITECEMEKKDLEESQDTSGKGPDIIPHSKDAEVFHLEGYLEDVHRSECLQKQDSPPTEYIRLKYMHTVL